MLDKDFLGTLVGCTN